MQQSYLRTQLGKYEPKPGIKPEERPLDIRNLRDDFVRYYKIYKEMRAALDATNKNPDLFTQYMQEAQFKGRELNRFRELLKTTYGKKIINDNLPLPDEYGYIPDVPKELGQPWRKREPSPLDNSRQYQGIKAPPEEEDRTPEGRLRRRSPISNDRRYTDMTKPTYADQRLPQERRRQIYKPLISNQPRPAQPSMGTPKVEYQRRGRPRRNIIG